MSRSGVLIVDKPAGITSHDVVDRVRRLVGHKRVGHAGTLDPFATGVLPVCFGTATRLAGYLAASAKRYKATVRFGFSTDSDDATGRAMGLVVRPTGVDRAVLEAACRGFEGEIEQMVPLFSAKRVEGRRLYERARAGETVSAPLARVRVDRIEVLSLQDDQAVLDIRCGAGTYIRALARDLGRVLGTGAHLAALRRTEAGGFSLAAARSLDAIAADLAAACVPTSRLLPELPAVPLGGGEIADVLHGRPLRRDGTGVAGRVRLVSEDGELVALADAIPGPRSVVVLQPKVVLATRG